MGEAKRRRDMEERAKKLVRPIERDRFNLYTMGTRLSHVPYMSEELSWWATNKEDLLGIVARDTTDDDYFWMILARDKIGRFRCASLDINFRTQDFAEMQLIIAMSKIIEADGIKEFGLQGDETNSPLDPFDVPTDLAADKLHPYFKILRDEPGRAPARKVISELALWLAPKDPHFVREFQTSGFDQRLWEMFLWAAFREFYLDVEQLDAPDFLCHAPGIEFTVEATTVGPSRSGALLNHPNPKTQEEREEFLRGYMPMKFAGALTNKLNKKNAFGERYWEREKSKGKPFAIAIADFHKIPDKDELGSMTYTQSALWEYLYGSRVQWHFQDETLIVEAQQIKEHAFEEKRVPSGFFDLPESENVSAIIFSNAATIAKFDRMGVKAGFGTVGYEYYRYGYRYNPDPNAVVGLPFAADVRDPEYKEYWTQEFQVFHNPKARIPLPFEAFSGAVHHFLENGILKSIAPEDTVISSFTVLKRVVDSK